MPETDRCRMICTRLDVDSPLPPSSGWHDGVMARYYGGSAVPARPDDAEYMRQWNAAQNEETESDCRERLKRRRKEPR
jgi:hypothetical protein